MFITNIGREYFGSPFGFFVIFVNNNMYFSSLHAMTSKTWSAIVAFPESTQNFMQIRDPPRNCSLAHIHSLATSEHIRQITDIISLNSSEISSEQELLQSLKRSEESFLLASLRECNKTVIFLAESNCFQFKKNVERERVQYQGRYSKT